MSITNTISKVPEKLKKKALYIEVTDMLNFVHDKACEDFKDIKFKFKDSEQLSDEVNLEIIREQGFEYINDVIATLETADTKTILNFISLINILKGHVDGLELVLTLLGFEFDIQQWWQQSPQGEPHTYDMDIFFNLSIVTNVFQTLNRIRTFSENYVYPKLLVINLIVDFDLAEAETAIAGFKTQEFPSVIEGSL